MAEDLADFAGDGDARPFPWAILKALGEYAWQAYEAAKISKRFRIFPTVDF